MNIQWMFWHEVFAEEVPLNFLRQLRSYYGGSYLYSRPTEPLLALAEAISMWLDKENR